MKNAGGEGSNYTSDHGFKGITPRRVHKPLVTVPRRRFSTSTEVERQPEDQPPSSPGLLAGKRCLITGASRGIGKAIAERFAEEGARCVLVGRKEEPLREVAKKLKAYEGLAYEEGNGHSHGVVQGDVGSVKFWEGFQKVVCFPCPEVRCWRGMANG